MLLKAKSQLRLMIAEYLNQSQATFSPLTEAFHIIMISRNSDPIMKNNMTKPRFSHCLMHARLPSTFHKHIQQHCPMQRVHGEENYIDLIHLSGPVRYLIIGGLSLSLIL